MTIIDTETVAPSTLVVDGAQLIDGEWVPSHSGRTIDVANPANGEVIARIPRSDAEDVEQAVQAGERAFPAWRDMNATARGRLLFRWADLIEQHSAALDSLESQEVGRPSWGPPPMAGQLRFIAGQTDKVQGVSLPTYSPDVVGYTLREPFGVVGGVIPWNAPGPMFITEVGAAIAAGNTIVMKPAEDAPLTPLALAKLSLEAGIPAGVINVVTGYGAEAGAAIPAHPRIRRMGFTGSPQTGRAIMEACSRNLTPLHLELGGKSPQVVFPDADLDVAAAAIATGVTLNTGQICAAGTRVIVDRSIHAEVVDKLADAMTKVTVGPWHQKVQMGPLINGKQHERVCGFIDIGKEQGATLVTGGGRPSGTDFDGGWFVEPTLFDDVTPDMRIAQEEIFGPVLSVIPVDGEAEAIEVANGVDYGLVASVWTRDVGTAVRMTRALQAGQVGVNNALGAGVIGGPFGGYKNSGFGRTMGADAVLEWTQVKTVSMREAPLPRF
ncbi:MULTISPECIES: aldehyde dehydrogenase family protein [unclassified Microbacterium]|uniref:aldehyde dehydrogenase family protein n=1 Tax=unclassified Microbacterium TaxID=2609290 RepID=UPI00097F124A|nr:aldehyde dehydrogenase family protein [Microbacterium sp. JB110]RCS60716.1 aldehyde dehydrogenase [Microbacterium sp. JB110]SJM44753.1 Aldehyde dehydrogenase [Frigoribacterium sp. JB110]